MVVCVVTTWCVADGSYEDANGYTAGYLETGSAGAWSVSAAPEPANAGTDAAGTEKAALAVVGCSADGGCLATGYYRDTGPTTEGLLVAVVPPAPTVTSISPTSGPSAGGTTVSVTGTWFFPGSAAAFGGVAGTAVSTSAPTTLTVTSPSGVLTVDVEVTTAGGTSGAVAGDRFTYTGGGTLTLAAPPTLYWGFALNGYDQWASASATPLSGCTAGGSGTTCSGGSAPTLEVLDTTGAGSGWALSAYVAAGTVPAGSLLDFDGSGSATAGASTDSGLSAFPFSASAPATVCEFDAGCVPVTPASSCSHPGLGFSTCPGYPVNVGAGTGPTAQVDLTSAALGTGEGKVCFAAGPPTGASCAGAAPSAFFDLGVPAAAAAGTTVGTLTLTVSSGP